MADPVQPSEQPFLIGAGAHSTPTALSAARTTRRDPPNTPPAYKTASARETPVVLMRMPATSAITREASAAIRTQRILRLRGPTVRFLPIDYDGRPGHKQQRAASTRPPITVIRVEICQRAEPQCVLRELLSGNAAHRVLLCTAYQSGRSGLTSIRARGAPLALLETPSNNVPQGQASSERRSPALTQVLARDRQGFSVHVRAAVSTGGHAASQGANLPVEYQLAATEDIVRYFGQAEDLPASPSGRRPICIPSDTNRGWSPGTGLRDTAKGWSTTPWSPPAPYGTSPVPGCGRSEPVAPSPSSTAG